MGKRTKTNAGQAQPQLGDTDRLGLRVSAMINSPKAQLERKVRIHRLDTDSDQAWDGVMELLAETDGIDMVFNDDGGVSLGWGGQGDEAEIDEEAGEFAPF
ncbi:DUF1654 domain-containing protein [Pseudomonas sp. 5P_3.1_Bac2]|uniref:DUF1654 domain-containing protein n=1 Tax=Pseudomonas sp. 5P_3.1_Bac2 TaxID=2971617 RepID=UPI0021C91FF7|nr:DUF1654 domain-containing protein [Pseudomonas sp. 5P_3.1_Bac2]MCU1717344.1 DUF1654 domain-containing protein [Pseudomonas sp. 5P_3.1_Bac2]